MAVAEAPVVSASLGPILGPMGPFIAPGPFDTCQKLEDCAFCATRDGPPKCGHVCLNYTVITKESMLDPHFGGDAEWCSAFRPLPRRCFLRWRFSRHQRALHVPHQQRCTGSPAKVVAQVLGALLLLFVVLALGLRGHVALWRAVRCWLRPRRTRRSSSRASASRSASQKRPRRPRPGDLLRQPSAGSDCSAH